MEAFKWLIGLTALALVRPGTVEAQIDNVSPPAGSMIWQYECKPGIKCPTRCVVKGTELFSTDDFLSLTILQRPDPVYWLRIDYGHTLVDYVGYGGQAYELSCSIIGATLKAIRVSEPEKPSATPQK